MRYPNGDIEMHVYIFTSGQAENTLRLRRGGKKEEGTREDRRKSRRRREGRRVVRGLQVGTCITSEYQRRESMRCVSALAVDGSMVGGSVRWMIWAPWG